MRKSGDAASHLLERFDQEGLDAIYPTGYRAFSREILENPPLDDNSDDFVLDAEMLAQIIYAGYSNGEIVCPTRYSPDSASINLINSIRYGLGVLHVSLAFRLSRSNIIMDRRFSSLDPRI